MSSLEVCTEKLLTQKAIQGSHYEHIAQQLTELHRTERNASLTLKSLLSDVERRLCDYDDVRLTGAELTKQLMQDKLKLQALMLAVSENNKVKHEVMQVFSECTEQWSTIPAELVQLLRILAERKQCISVAQEFTAQLIAAKVVYCTAHNTIKLHKLVERGIHGQLVEWTHANSELALQCTIVTTSVKESVETAMHRMSFILQSCNIKQINAEQWLLQVEEANSVELIKHDGLRQRGDLARQYVRELLQCVEQSACTITHMQEKLTAAHKAAEQLRESANAQATVHAQAKQKRNDEEQSCKEKLVQVQNANGNMAAQTKSLQSAISATQKEICNKHKEVYVLEWMARLLASLHTQIADDKHKAAVLEENATMTEMDWKHKQEIALESVRMARYQSQCREAVQALIAEESLTRRAMCVEETDKRQWCATEFMKAEAEWRQREKLEMMKKKKQEEEELIKHKQQKWKVELHNTGKDRDKGRKGASKRDRAIATQLNEAALRQHERYYNGNENNTIISNKYSKSAKLEIAKLTTCPFLAGTASSVATSHSTTTTATNNRNNHYSRIGNNTVTQTYKRPRSTIISKKANTKTDTTNEHKPQTTHTQSVPSPSPLPRRPHHIPLSQQEPFSSLSSVIIPFPAISLTQTHRQQTQQMNTQEQYFTQQINYMDKALLERKEEEQEDVGAADEAKHDEKNAELEKQLLYLPENKQSIVMTGQNKPVTINKRNNDMFDNKKDENDNDGDEKEDDSDKDTNSMASAVSVLSAALSTLKNVTTVNTTAADTVESETQKQKPENDNTHYDKHVRFDEQGQKQRQPQRRYWNSSQYATQRNWQWKAQNNALKEQNSKVHLPSSPSPSPSSSSISPSSPVLSEMAPALLIRNRTHNQSNRPLALPQLPVKEQQWQAKVHPQHEKFVPSIKSETSSTLRATAAAANDDDDDNDDEIAHVVNKKSNVQDRLHTTIPAKRPVRPSRIKMTRTERGATDKLTQSRHKNDISCSDDIFADIYSEKILELLTKEKKEVEFRSLNL